MERNTYVLQGNENIGSVQIADDVIAVIAGLAATEVEGVSAMAGNITNELMTKVGVKNLTKGVKVDIIEGVVTVAMALNLKYGFNIMAVSGKVQERKR